MAAAASHSLSFVSEWTDGFNTELGESSKTRCSGGEKQRIAIARALVRNPRTEHVRAAGAVDEIDLDFVLAERSEAPRLLIGRGDGAPMLADVSKKYYKERLANSALVPPGTVAGLEMLEASKSKGPGAL